MARFTYIAQRTLGTGHTVGLQYSLELDLSVGNRAVRFLKEPQESMSGAVETVFHGIVATWDVRTYPVRYDDTEYILEMLDSTADGQIFQFDPYGTVAVPERLMTVVREDDGYSEERALEVGDWEEDHFVFGFQVRET